MDNFNYNRLDNNRLTFPRAIFCLRSLLWFLVAVFFVWVVVKAQENVVPWDEADMILVNDTTISPIFREFYKCVKPKLAPLKGNYQNFWYDFTNVISECDSLEAYTALDIRPSRNRDETKYVAFPRKNENLTMVTLGIGHDVSAEIRLRELYPNIQFFGADPSSEINKNLYEKSLGGKYFQYAVSDQNGIDDSVVLGNDGYVQQKTQHIGIDHFFKNIVQKSKIDILWMDIEGNEYPVLNQLHHDGNLDRQGVKICQLNVEMHKDLSNLQEMKLFHNFIWKVLEDRKYIFMKPVFVKWQQFRFIRLFIVNIADQECTDLYVK
ncbi:hypothetical protein L3Y34_007748 [Caenorhabditis briggsae]|uniref:Methyltransferase FkbM domain-containing protein n=1 Tax=Caenorhabditis briggsae TaxID=6238 RepID=A0AAE9A0Q3_CAEBR|nr:hypothetical protein L3Y34_007748 [Caenorhabditis briggsae]